MVDIKLVLGRIRELTPQETAQHPKFEYVVCNEYRCYYGEEKIVVPAGFLSDGATKAPDIGISWLIHDYLYATHRFADGSPCSRKQADQIMYRILQYEGNRLSSYIYYMTTKVAPCFYARAWKKSGKRGPIILGLDDVIN